MVIKCSNCGKERIVYAFSTVCTFCYNIPPEEVSENIKDVSVDKDMSTNVEEILNIYFKYKNKEFLILKNNPKIQSGLFNPKDLKKLNESNPTSKKVFDNFLNYYNARQSGSGKIAGSLIFEGIFDSDIGEVGAISFKKEQELRSQIEKNKKRNIDNHIRFPYDIELRELHTDLVILEETMGVSFSCINTLKQNNIQSTHLYDNNKVNLEIIFSKGYVLENFLNFKPGDIWVIDKLKADFITPSLRCPKWINAYTNDDLFNEPKEEFKDMLYKLRKHTRSEDIFLRDKKGFFKIMGEDEEELTAGEILAGKSPEEFRLFHYSSEEEVKEYLDLKKQTINMARKGNDWSPNILWVLVVIIFIALLIGSSL